MGPELRTKLLVPYPAWHDQPLRLSLEELMQPHRVLAEFFDAYNLPAIRTCLRQWLEDALRADDAAAADHYFTHSHIEKLVEAAWLLTEGPRHYDTDTPTDTVEEHPEPYGRQTLLRDLPFFNSIHLHSFCHITLAPGDRESACLQGPSALLRELTLKVEDNTLVIQDGPTANKAAFEALTLHITYTELKLLATCSTGSIRTLGPIREADLYLVQNGTGAITVEADAGTVQAVVHGAGRLTLKGQAHHTHIISYGPGDVDGQQWHTRNATLFLSGSGTVTLTISRRIEGSIGNGARLHYRGTPAFRALQLSDGATALALDKN